MLKWESRFKKTISQTLSVCCTVDVRDYWTCFAFRRVVYQKTMIYDFPLCTRPTRLVTCDLFVRNRGKTKRLRVGPSPAYRSPRYHTYRKDRQRSYDRMSMAGGVCDGTAGPTSRIHKLPRTEPLGTSGNKDNNSDQLYINHDDSSLLGDICFCWVSRRMGWPLTTVTG